MSLFRDRDRGRSEVVAVLERASDGERLDRRNRDAAALRVDRQTCGQAVASRAAETAAGVAPRKRESRQTVSTPVRAL